MSMYTGITIVCWLILLAYWGYNSRKVKTAVFTQTKTSRYVYLFFLLTSFIILYFRFAAVGILGYQIIPVNRFTGLAGAGICVAGVAFAIWARKFLGDNWSAEVTLKQGHKLIQSGPYQFVRHPIYTGFEIAFLGTVITIGQLKGFVGLGILFTNHFYKTMMEEKILREQFREQYLDYAKRVRRLIPFIF
jgi:protein-S-isoprenylcysteine O-methyltransferase Ste14